MFFFWQFSVPCPNWARRSKRSTPTRSRRRRRRRRRPGSSIRNRKRPTRDSWRTTTRWRPPPDISMCCCSRLAWEPDQSASWCCICSGRYFWLLSLPFRQIRLAPPLPFRQIRLAPPLPFRQISSRPGSGRANHNCLSNSGAGLLRWLYRGAPLRHFQKKNKLLHLKL